MGLPQPSRYFRKTQSTQDTGSKTIHIENLPMTAVTLVCHVLKERGRFLKKTIIPSVFTPLLTSARFSLAVIFFNFREEPMPYQNIIAKCFTRLPTTMHLKANATELSGSWWEGTPIPHPSSHGNSTLRLGRLNLK